MLRDLMSSGSLKKSSFFKKNFVLFLTKILLFSPLSGGCSEGLDAFRLFIQV